MIMHHVFACNYTVQVLYEWIHTYENGPVECKATVCTVQYCKINGVQKLKILFCSDRSNRRRIVQIQHTESLHCCTVFGSSIEETVLQCLNCSETHQNLAHSNPAD